MNDLKMEMQFADPDWRPASSRPGRSPGEQALSIPLEITNAADPRPQADEQPARRIWTPRPGQTPPLTMKSTSADAISGAGQARQIHQKQQPAPVHLKSRRGRRLLALMARVALVVIWFTTPLISRAFHGGWVVPLLGVFFLPMTALTYTVISALVGSVTGLGWLWVAVALLLDLARYGGQTNKRGSGLPQQTSKGSSLSTLGSGDDR